MCANPFSYPPTNSPDARRHQCDRYRHFAHLCQHENEGSDYVVLSRAGNTGLLVMAPHAGGIEPGTGELADATAAERHSFYGFKGIKRRHNRVLHIASNRFDEPRAMAMVKEAAWVLAIHGCRDKSPNVWVGGRDQHHGHQIIQGLQADGFPAQASDRPGLRGRHPQNLCNRGRTGVGVQLELSSGLRHKLFADLGRQCPPKPTRLFHQFVHTLRACIRE